MRIRPSKVRTARQQRREERAERTIDATTEEERAGIRAEESSERPSGWRRGDGSIVEWRKPGSDRIYWVLFITVDGKRRGFYHDSQEEAIEHQRALRTRGDDTGPRTTVDKYLVRWLAAHKARGSLREKSAQRYGEVIARMIPYLKGLPLRTLTTRQVQAMLDKMATAPNGRGQKLSPGTVAKVRAVLRAALSTAVAEGLIERNPAVDVTLPRASRVVPTLWNAEERERFIAAIKGDRLEALYLTAIWQGLREGELIGLRWQDIDMKRNKLTVAQQVQWNGHPQITDLKTLGSHRTISLHPTVTAALKVHRTAWTAPQKPWSALVFPSTAGTPQNPNNLIRAFHAVLERASLPVIRFHDLRRLCATQMAIDNVPVRVTMHFLGHSSVTTTMNIYASIGERDEEAALAKVWNR